MTGGNIYIYILVAAAVTYLVRMLPLTLVRREIKNRYIKSFLYYMPYATLSAMTFPAILFACGSVLAAACGFAVALILAFFRRSMFEVAIAACVVVFVFERILL